MCLTCWRPVELNASVVRTTTSCPRFARASQSLCTVSGGPPYEYAGAKYGATCKMRMKASRSSLSQNSFDSIWTARKGVDARPSNRLAGFIQSGATPSDFPVVWLPSDHRCEGPVMHSVEPHVAL